MIDAPLPRRGERGEAVDLLARTDRQTHASFRPDATPTAARTAGVTDDDTLLRLAVWLADVATEAAPAARAAEAVCTPERAVTPSVGPADEPLPADPAV